MHDCNPPSEIVATPLHLLEAARMVPEWTGAWTGDVWKTIAHLRSSRDDLNIFVLNCDWGLGIITRGRSEQMLDYSDKDIEQMTYLYLDEKREKILNLKSELHFNKFLKDLI